MTIVPLFTGIIPNIIIPILLVFLLFKLTPIFKYHLDLQSKASFFMWLIIGAIGLNCVSVAFYFSIKEIINTLPNTSYIFISGVLSTTVDVLKDFFRKAMFNQNITTMHMVNAFVVLSIIVFFKIINVFNSSWYKAYDFKCQRMAYGPLPELEQLFLDANKKFAPVMVTMRNRKVYVGWVINYQLSEIENQSTYISLFLIASGYRHTEDLHFKIRNDYSHSVSVAIENGDEKILKSLSNGIVLPEDEIVSAALWLEDVYNNMNIGDT